MATARVRPPLNSFGISFGLSGLAGTWSEAARSLASPQVVAEALWVLAIAAWLVTVVLILNRAPSWRALADDVRHPVLGPFTALVPLPPMIWGAHLAATDPVVGTILVWLGATASAVFGAWFVAQLLAVPRGLAAVHGGYFLPAVAASLLSAQSLAVIRQDGLALPLFGVGVLFWALVGGAVLARLMAGPELPGGLLPTLGIFSAPPAVAGNAWWVMTGGDTGAVGMLLAGSMVAVLAPHLFLLRRYLRLEFVVGFWALTFTTAASATFGLRLLAASSTSGWAMPAGWAVLGIATAVIALIAAFTVRLWLGSALSRRSAHRAALDV
ncbi:hypothetical protein N1031_05990 [Herbiconiux moechotypicola]|uniref:Dicarboxylate transporter/tellurite-resistance protein TehA n=1 Tax=Herbiconiux moechotypicola TaxID=637393 RepID=A0ABN3DEG5_9MICO|nr:hypothetical protein [Herbiconiux moechotypicola]MCS5729306.1 hypothetical protein [Herbiconiux moechotypicola]